MDSDTEPLIKTSTEDSSINPGIHQKSTEYESINSESDIHQQSNPGESIDDILRKSGGFGRYQILFQIIATLSIPTIGYQLISMYYLADDPSWQCAPGTYSNTSTFCQHHPGIIKTDSDFFQQRCSLAVDDWKFAVPNPSEYSIITEYHLYCSRGGLASLAESSFFIGSAIASIFIGYASDNFGRKYVFCIVSVILFISACSLSFVTSAWQFIVIRAIIGISSCCNSSLYVLSLEFVQPKHRALVSNIFNTYNAFGFLYLTLIAYFNQGWRKVALYSALPGVLTFLFFGAYRSPRWLQSKGRTKEAELVLKKLSIFNNLPIQTIQLASVDEKKLRKSYSIIDFFRFRKVAILVGSLFAILYLNGVIWYTMYLEYAKVGASLYSMLALSASADFPAMICASYFPNKYGRKKSVFCGSFLTALCSVPIIFLPEHYEHAVLVRIVSCLTMKLFYVFTLDTISVWSSEIFPTPVRAQGVVLVGLGLAIGAATAPFIVAFLNTLHYTVPFIAIIIVCCMQAVLCLILPETLLMPTREHFEDFFNQNIDSQDTESI